MTLPSLERASAPKTRGGREGRRVPVGVVVVVSADLEVFSLAMLSVCPLAGVCFAHVCAAPLSRTIITVRVL